MSDDSGSTLDPDKIPRRRGLHIREIKEEAPEPEQTVGTELRAAREAAGKELNELAAALRIKPEHLIALEAAEYDKLPAKTYVVGFVRQYAQVLGLNANELVERLKVELEGPEPEEETLARGEAPSRRAGPVRIPGGVGGGPGAPVEGESRLPVTSIAIVVILLLVVIFGGWFLTRPSGDSNSTADKEAETGSKSAPAVPDESSGDGGQRMPDPPVIPAAAGNQAAARGGGSLTALLPGADRLEQAAGADEQVPLKMPDAAALAVPIENRAGAPEGGAEEAASEREAGQRPGEFSDTAMPQPNLALRTSRSRPPGVPEAASGEAEEAGTAEGEPALEDIEAEGVGGAARTEEEPESAPQTRTEPEPRPQPAVRPEQPPAEEAQVYGAATAKSRVTLRVRSSTWVRVEDADGRVIIERDMRSGDSFRAPDVKGLYLVTKDAGAIELLLDGESIGRAGRSKQVLTGLLLSPDQLRQRVAQNASAPEIP